MEVKCVIFDMDGLMFDSERVVGECFKKAAKEYGYGVSDEIRLQLLGRNKTDNTKTLKGYFGDDYPQEKISQLSTKYKNEYIQKYGLPVKDGLYNLLKYLNDHHIFIAVASSSNYDVIVHYLNISNTYQYIDYIASGDRVHESKPNPEIFINVLNHFQLKPSQALVLEDSKYGILAAVNGHIPVICIPDLVYHDVEINNQTLAVLDNLNQVITFLDDCLG